MRNGECYIIPAQMLLTKYCLVLGAARKPNTITRVGGRGASYPPLRAWMLQPGSECANRTVLVAFQTTSQSSMS